MKLYRVKLLTRPSMQPALTIYRRLSTVDYRPSTIDHQSYVLCHLPSATFHLPSAVFLRLLPAIISRPHPYSAHHHSQNSQGQ